MGLARLAPPRYSPEITYGAFASRMSHPAFAWFGTKPDGCIIVPIAFPRVA